MSGARLTGHPTNRLPNSASFVFEDTDGESILMDLDQHDICASSGSACTSGHPRSVPRADGAGARRDELARGSVRLTTGRATTDADVEQLLDVMPDVVARVRSIMPMLLGDARVELTRTRPSARSRELGEEHACDW